jgi:asparagine synthase (glutamine-hydrolysing)
MSPVNRLDALIGALDRSVRDRLTRPEGGIMFSGGVDSCVVASLASNHVLVTLYTVGVEGAHDLKVGESSALAMGLAWKGINIVESDIREAIPFVAKWMGTTSPLALSFEMPVFFVSRAAFEDVVLCGQGADELFGGYARYEAMSPSERRDRMKVDADALISNGAPAERRLASAFGKELGHPYLDRSVVELASSLPDDMLVNKGVRKVALRQVATALGLEEAALRPKKAAQYGSGIMKAMKVMAKREGLSLKDWTAKVIAEKEGRA